MKSIPTTQMNISTDTQQTCSVVFLDITEETKLQCVKCLKPEDEIADCDLCNRQLSFIIYPNILWKNY